MSINAYIFVWNELKLLNNTNKWFFLKKIITGSCLYLYIYFQNNELKYGKDTISIVDSKMINIIRIMNLFVSVLYNDIMHKNYLLH